jgi:AraC-like DNA-binding protein
MGTAAMRFNVHKPRPPLSEFIEEMRLYENYAAGHAHERILPTGTFAIIFNLRDNELRIYRPEGDFLAPQRFSGALISGPYASPFMTDMAEEGSTLGVHFKPGGAFPFLGGVVRELANKHADLRDIFGPAATELHQRLSEPSCPVVRFALLEEFLLARLVRRPTSHQAVRIGLGLVLAPNRTLVRDIAKTVDLSERRFIEVFAAEIGLTPKLLARVQRFHQALALSDDASIDWADIAARCGYFDQAHLIRDFVEFAGDSPVAYRLRQRQAGRAGLQPKRHHVPLFG